uniref:Leucine-rich repeat-containing protein 19 n=1 Tax=Esox lucius TaxID=8010 RepID=A0A3P9A3H3_ESOLU
MAVQELLLVWLASTTLSSGAAKVEDLQAVDLSNHDLKSIPSNYTGNTKLILSNNSINITITDEAILQRYSNLTELHLNGNLLTVLPGKLFKTMSKLEVLLLSNNKIKTVEPKALSGLVNLRELDLSNNLLESFPGDLLAGLEKLSILRLQGNKLQTLNIPTDQCILQKLDVEGNSWNCTCSFLKLIKSMTDSGVNISSHAVCASPEELANKRIVDNSTRCFVEPTTIEPPPPTTKPSSAPDTTNTAASKKNAKVSDKDVEPGSGRPSVGNTWKFLLGVVVIALTTSMVIVCAVKSPSWYKLLFNYRHQRLREEEDSNVFTTGRYSNFSLDTEQMESTTNDLENGLDKDDEDDGYIEDRYIEDGDYKDSTEP